MLWHTLNADGEPVAFYRRHLDLQGVPAAGKPVLLARSGVDWVWDLGGTRYLAGWFMDPKQALGARFLTGTGVMPLLQPAQALAAAASGDGGTALYEFAVTSGVQPLLTGRATAQKRAPFASNWGMKCRVSGSCRLRFQLLPRWLCRPARPVPRTGQTAP